jgi:hypothetical protein
MARQFDPANLPRRAVPIDAAPEVSGIPPTNPQRDKAAGRKGEPADRAA